jgi:methylated-DNA-[protein]-cysteine S-methyltransferase
MSLHPPDLHPGEAAALAARTAARAADDGAAPIAYALVDAPVGRLVAVATPQGLVRLAYELENGGLDSVLDVVARRLSPAIVEAPAKLDAVRRELDEYFEHRRTAFDLPIDWALVTPFGRRVLQATKAIPFGEVSTYGRIAADAGNPKAARATGNALGSNPMPIVVPCHRVLHTGGHGIGNYTGGVHRKEALLRLEGVLLG